MIELKSGDNERIDEEFGDLLFSLINFSRHIGIDANSSLEKSNKKFIKRFKLLEKIINEKNRSFDNLSNNELNKLWVYVKKINS